MWASSWNPKTEFQNQIDFNQILNSFFWNPKTEFQNQIDFNSKQFFGA